jgi:hypothetical protein
VADCRCDKISPGATDRAELGARQCERGPLIGSRMSITGECQSKPGCSTMTAGIDPPKALNLVRSASLSMRCVGLARIGPASSNSTRRPFPTSSAGPTAGGGLVFCSVPTIINVGASNADTSRVPECPKPRGIPPNWVSLDPPLQCWTNTQSSRFPHVSSL